LWWEELPPVPRKIKWRWSYTSKKGKKLKELG
jgi:hypothetical protein